MLPLRKCLVIALLLIPPTITPALVLADDVDAAKEKLLKAKDEYDTEVQTFNKAVIASLDVREEVARKNGNKKTVDDIKAQRKAFEADGELPTVVPPSALTQVRLAAAKCEKAHADIVKELIRLKQDAAAEAVEKEMRKFEFDAALQFGKRTYLSALKASNVKVWNKFFETDSKKGQIDGRVIPHSILMHPDVRTYANVSFQLDGKSSVFRATVGTPKHDPTLGDPASPLTFEVLADGKSVWKSEPVTKVATFQTCAIRVEKVKTLTLRVHCENEHGGAHAAWLAPFVAE